MTWPAPTSSAEQPASVDEAPPASWALPSLKATKAHLVAVGSSKAACGRASGTWHRLRYPLPGPQAKRVGYCGRCSDHQREHYPPPRLATRS